MTRLEQLRAELDTLHTHLTHAQAQASVAYTSAAAAQTEYAKQLEVIEKDGAAIRDLEALLDKRDAEVARLTAEIVTLRAQIADLEAQLKARPPANPIPEPPKPPISPATPRAVIPITVRNPSPSMPRAAGEYVSAAIPLAREYAVLTLADLAIRNPATGFLIPADFRITARWNGLADTTSPAQWVLATFPLSAGIVGDTTATYDLLVGVDGRPALDGYTVLTVASLKVGTDNSTAYRIDTGPVRFEVDNRGLWPSVKPMTLGTTFTQAAPQALDTTFNGTTISTPKISVRALTLEYEGPLTATVIVDGTLPADPSISVRRRYTFYAGSSVATCTERIAWESTSNGNSARRKDGTPNAILGTLVRERFKAPADVRAVRVLDRIDKPVREMADPSPGVRLTQHLRSKRLVSTVDTKGKTAFVAISPFYSIASSKGEETAKGGEATGGALAIDTPTSSVAIALRDFHRYEPQALAYDPTTGELHIDLAADRFWLAHHQGMHATYAIAVSDTPIELTALWRMLNTPLRGLPSVAAHNASGAVTELPDRVPGSLGPIKEKYERSLASIILATLTKREAEGLQGLMTWGLYPRQWGEWGTGTGELGKVDTWDGAYLQGSWTDYWNTTRIAYEWALLTGNPAPIDSITLPAALRSLHTQSMIAAPTDPYPYAGSLPAGYGLYRDDFNSSHQYVENLFAYYHLTGDTTVTGQLERAARVQLARFRVGEASGSGRHPNQWLSIFRFLAYTSPSKDINWGEEFDVMMRTAIHNHYVQGMWQGRVEAIWTDTPASLSLTVAEKGGSPAKLNTSTIYSIGYYDAENLYWFMRRTADAKLPTLDIRPSEVIVRLARTTCTLAPTLAGGTPGDAGSKWCRAFTETHDGRDAFTSFAALPLDSQPLLFPDDKPAMASWLSRATTLSAAANGGTPDPVLARTSRSLVEYAFTRIIGRGIPMGKLMGLCSGRLSAAVAEEMKRS